MFKMKFLAAAALAFITGAFAGPIDSRAEAPVTTQDIMLVTGMSRALRTTTNNITIFNAVFEGRKVPEGFQQIIQTVNIAIGHLEAPPTDPYPPADADIVVDVLVTFVEIHQALLNVVIGKHGILAAFFFTEPVRQVLVALESVIDQYAFDLIAMIPTRAPDAMVQVNMLGETLSKAIATYS